MKLRCCARCFPCTATSFAVWIGLYSVLSQVWTGNKIALHVQHGITDLAIRSRGGTALYRLFGDAIEFADTSATLAAPVKPVSDQVTVVRTAKGTTERLAQLPPIALRPGTVPKELPSVIIDSEVRYQTFMGFGGSFTESSADLFRSASAANQKRILDAYFRNDTGLGYTMGRLHMNSCDFSTGRWSCDDVAGDVELKHFNIDRYHASMIPLMKRAAETAGAPLTLLASPWSPPGWMKDTLQMVNGGKLSPQYRKPWSRFYVKFAEEMKRAGVPLWGFTVQNEPDAVTPWENSGYTAEEERDFVRDYLGPALEASGLDLKLLVWDHNRNDMFLRAQTIYSDPNASKYVWGVGYHWYGDPKYEIWPDRAGQLGWENVQRVHELRPEKHIMMTEACQESGPRIGNWELGERYAEAIIRDLNHWLEAWIDWNLILDESGGPNHVGNLVSAPVIVDNAKDRVLFLSSFFYLGHFSRYIRPGAQRVAVASNRDSLETTAFVNPDGTIVVVVMNKSDWQMDFWIRHGGRSVETSAPPHSITTYMFNEPA